MKETTSNILDHSIDIGIGKIETIPFVSISSIQSAMTEVMRVTLDGGFVVNESIPATDAARHVLSLMKDQWMADAQATKIRELENELECCKMLIRDLERSRNNFRDRVIEQNSSMFGGEPDRRLPWEKTPEEKL